MSVSLATKGMISPAGVGAASIYEEIVLSLEVVSEPELTIVVENEIEITVEVCDA